MAAAYGYDISRPAATAREAVQWLYFGYLAAVKEQNGAAMSLGRTSTFLDCLPRSATSPPALLDEERRPGADRRLRDEAARRALPAHPRVRRAVQRRPDLGHRVASAASATDGRPLVTRTSFRYLQTLYNLGPAPEPNLTVLWSPALPDGFKRFCAQVSIDTSARSSTSPTTCIRPRFGDDTAIACCVSAMRGRQADAVLRRAREPRQGAAVRDQRRPRRDQRRCRSRRATPAADAARCLDFDERAGRATTGCSTGSPRPTSTRSTSSTTCTTSTPTSGSRWRCTTATCCARWRAASPGCPSRPTRCRRSGTRGSRPVRDETGLIVDYRVDGELPGLRQRRRPRRRARHRARRDVHGEGAPRTRRTATPSTRQSVLTITSNVVYGQPHRRHPRRPAAPASPFAPGRQPDERPRPPRRRRRRAVGRQAPVQATPRTASR